MRQPLTRRAGRAIFRGRTAMRLARWRMIRLAAIVLGLFVAFNGVSAVGDEHAGPGAWAATAVVVAMGVGVWIVLSRLAGQRPQ